MENGERHLAPGGGIFLLHDWRYHSEAPQRAAWLNECRNTEHRAPWAVDSGQWTVGTWHCADKRLFRHAMSTFSRRVFPRWKTCVFCAPAATDNCICGSSWVLASQSAGCLCKPHMQTQTQAPFAPVNILYYIHIYPAAKAVAPAKNISRIWTGKCCESN